MTDLPGAEAQMSGTPGAVLAAAREAAGLTPADVAAQMRISLRQLEAIESDRYDELPGAVFVRGFVRNYARLLNLDPLPLLHALEPALGAEVPLRAQQFAGALPVHTRRGHTRLWLGLFLVLLLAVLGAAAYEYWRSRTASPPPSTTSGTSVQPDAPPAAGPGSTQVPASAPVPLAPERVSQSTSAPSPPGGSADASPASAVSAPAASENAAAARGRLELSFVAESWVEVRDRTGNVIFSATGAANTTRTVEGMPPLAVTIGNASGVRIAYNQRPIDVAANASRNIARLTLE